MKIFYRTISLIAIVIFLIGVGLVIYELYFLKDNLLNNLSVKSAASLQKIDATITRVSITVGSVLLVALLSIMLLALGAQRIVIKKIETIGDERDNKGKTTANDIILQNYNLEKITNLISLHTDVKELLEKTISVICTELEACQGSIYNTKIVDDVRVIEFVAGYAYYLPESQTLTYEFGEGLAGQVAKDGRIANIKNVPEGYLKVLSGLGDASPNNLLIAPLKNTQEIVIGVIEVAAFKAFSQNDEAYLQQVARILSEHVKFELSEQNI